MKLRVRGNSIRLRLTRSEVAAFREGRVVEETVALAPSRFSYAIVRAAVPRVRARFDGARLAIEVPEEITNDFCDTDRVGFDAQDDAVTVLVEKDWQCLAPRDEDDDAYPHPQAKLDRRST
jgi:hypothetical protein